MRQFMDSTVPESVLESARLDGAKELTIYWRIVMPMVKPAWLTLIVYCFQGLWNSGTSVYIYSEELKTFNYAIQQILAGGIVRSGASAAATVIMMLVPVTVFVVTQSNRRQTRRNGGVYVALRELRVLSREWRVKSGVAVRAARGSLNRKVWSSIIKRE